MKLLIGIFCLFGACIAGAAALTEVATQNTKNLAAQMKTAQSALYTGQVSFSDTDGQTAKYSVAGFLLPEAGYVYTSNVTSLSLDLWDNQTSDPDPNGCHIGFGVQGNGGFAVDFLKATANAWFDEISLTKDNSSGQSGLAPGVPSLLDLKFDIQPALKSTTGFYYLSGAVVVQQAPTMTATELVSWLSATPQKTIAKSIKIYKCSSGNVSTLSNGHVLFHVQATAYAPGHDIGLPDLRKRHSYAIPYSADVEVDGSGNFIESRNVVTQTPSDSNGYYFDCGRN